MKLIIAASLVILSLNASTAQTKLSLKLTPGVITQRIVNNDNLFIASKSPVEFNTSVSFLIEMPLTRNSYYIIGLGYTSKHMNLVAKDDFDNIIADNNYYLQYIRLPMMMRLYTSEVALDKRLYFLFGPVIEVLVHRKETNPEAPVIGKIVPFDFPLYLGMGIEIQVGARTAIQIGANYQRGLLGLSASPSVNTILKNDIYAIEFAVRF